MEEGAERPVIVADASNSGVAVLEDVKLNCTSARLAVVFEAATGAVVGFKNGPHKVSWHSVEEDDMLMAFVDDRLELKLLELRVQISV